VVATQTRVLRSNLEAERKTVGEPRGRRNLHVVSVAPLIASAIGRFIADGSFGDLS